MELFELQDTVERINKNACWDSKSQPNPYEDVASLAEELGELGREVRKYEQHGVRKGHQEVSSEVEVREHLIEELGDTLAALITIANRYSITLEEVAYRYQDKMAARGF